MIEEVESRESWEVEGKIVGFLVEEGKIVGLVVEGNCLSLEELRKVTRQWVEGRASGGAYLGEIETGYKLDFARRQEAEARTFHSVSIGEKHFSK